jgi:hypothetical protein
MKTILVPTEDDNAMGSALETALLLARRCDSYIEGFVLRWKIAELAAADMMGAVVFQADHQEIARMETQARAVFESFMRKNGVKRSTETTNSLSFGWLENAPEGDSFVGSTEIQVACTSRQLIPGYSRAVDRYSYRHHPRQAKSPPTC